MFSVEELTEYRADQVSAMPDVCLVSTPGASVSDGAGGFTDGTATTITVACRVGPPSTAEREIASRLGQETDTVVTMPYGTLIPEGATITAGGTAYQEVGVNVGQSFGTAVRVRVRRVS